MKFRGLFLIFLSLILGIGVVSLMNGRSTGPHVVTAKVVTSKATLKFGDRLSAEVLQVTEFPPEAVPQGAFSKIEDLIGDRVVLRPIVVGEPVLASKVSDIGGKATLSTMVEKGMRGFTIRVNDVTGGGGFVLPQARVDVLVTRNEPNQPKETTVLLQNVRVLAVDQQIDEGKDSPVVAKAVTLEVTAEDAQKLTLGSTSGFSLSLALRNYANPEPISAHSVSVSDLFPSSAPALPASTTGPTTPAPLLKHSVEIIRGTAATSYEVNSGEVTHKSVSTIPKRPVRASADLINSGG